MVLGKRIPVGVACTGAITFAGDIWNVTHPEMALSVAAWGGLAACLTACLQVAVVNIGGVTNADKNCCGQCK